MFQERAQPGPLSSSVSRTVKHTEQTAALIQLPRAEWCVVIDTFKVLLSSPFLREINVVTANLSCDLGVSTEKNDLAQRGTLCNISP